MRTLDHFIADIARSRLVEPGPLERALGAFAREPESDAAARFARALIRDGLLTDYQARKLLAGATRGFFLGDYRVLRSLGEGMGKVFLAEHNETGELVAVKVLPPRRALEEERALARFRREMELSRRATHTNLARTIDVGTQDGVHFMVLEFIPGESLYEIVKGEGGGPLRLGDTVRLFRQVVGGLGAAHEAGLVHRDIKPSNIMVTPDGEAKVLDLGLARLTGDDRPLTTPNMVVGTLDYASPEQLVNAAAADRRSDLYSVGCTLYFTLAGRPPFEGGDMVNKMFKQRMEDPEPLERVARGAPAFAAVVRKLMAKAPGDRYQTCEELRADLDRWGEAVAPAVGRIGVRRPARATVFEADEDDLRLLPDEPTGGPNAALRDLGDAAPAPAPYRTRSHPP